MSELQRFVDAQQPVYAEVVAQLRAGRKTTHWMWFIFPQLAGLGRSSTALYFGIADVDEARDYLHHPVLGARLRECAAIVAGLAGPPRAVFGDVDALKLRSSLTLFGLVEPDTFQPVLDRHFAGQPDRATLDLLGPHPLGAAFFVVR
ncbi:MAG: DUF1810 domain-containing protein [Mycobacteriales bacterium]